MLHSSSCVFHLYRHLHGGICCIYFLPSGHCKNAAKCSDKEQPGKGAREISLPRLPVTSTVGLEVPIQRALAQVVSSEFTDVKNVLFLSSLLLCYHNGLTMMMKYSKHMTETKARLVFLQLPHTPEECWPGPNDSGTVFGPGHLLYGVLS